MSFFARSALLLFLLLPAFASAQTYPSRSETAVTDDAELLGPVAEAELAARLTALGQDTGSEIAVVTLPSMALYTGGDDLDVYSRGLMASWSLGDTTADRGVLMLVFAQDRELRIELGAGFGADAEAAARAVVADTMVPAFQADDYSRGITEGVDAIATRILVAGDATAPTAPAEATTPDPVATTAPATETEGGGTGILVWIGGGVAALVALVIGANRRAAAKLAATPCPSCGKTGLTRERVTLAQATEKREGHGEVRTSCPHCGNVGAEPFTIARKDPKVPEKDTKGGGLNAKGPAAKSKGPASKGGGGASGEW